MPRTRTRPSLPPLARVLRALLAVLVLSVLCALPAQAQEGAPDPAAPPAPPPAEPTIAVTPPNGGAVHTLAWSTLRDSLDLEKKTYEVPGTGRQDLTGIALGSLLEKMSYPKGSYSAVTATTAAGLELQVSQTQINAPGEVPAIVYLDPADGALRLLRPATNADPRGTEVAVAVDGVLALRLRAEAKVTASTQQAQVNKLVTFSASVPPGVDASRVVYEWDFNDDGAPTRTRVAQTSHSFKRAGAYNVVVTFYVDGTRYDADFPPSVDVAVEAPVSVEKPRRGAKKANRRRAAERGGEGAGRDDGAGEETAGGDGGGSDLSGGGDASGGGDGTSGGGGGGFSGDDASGGGAPSAPAPAPAPAATPEPPAEPEPAPDPPSARRKAAAPPEQPAVPPIDGYLLASADGQPIDTSGALAPAAADVEPLANRDGPLHIPAIAWVLAGLLALVVLGWALESRTTLPYFKP